MVFEPSAVPRNKTAFDAWFSEQTRWSEEHGYDDPAVMSPVLQAWFDDIRKNYPPMNGPLAMSDEEFDRLGSEGEARVTDYSIGRSLIYAAFAWSVADEAEKAVRNLARRHKVGFYHPGSGEAWFPDDERLFRVSSQSADPVNNATWEDVWLAINRLPTGKHEFITLEETTRSGDILYMQALYQQSGKDGFYLIEAQPMTTGASSTAMPKYSYRSADVTEVSRFFRDWFVWNQSPDYANWNDEEISPSAINPKNERTNKLLETLIVIVALAIIIGIIAYIAKDFF